LKLFKNVPKMTVHEEGEKRAKLKRVIPPLKEKFQKERGPRE